jgi:hypothetical protein
MKEENLNKAINLYEKIQTLRQVVNSVRHVEFGWKKYSTDDSWVKLPSDLDCLLLDAVRAGLAKLEKELEEL